MLRIPPPKRQIGVRHHLPFASRILRGRQLHTLTFRPGASLARQTVGSHLRVIASAGHPGRVNCASASSQEKDMISAEDIGRTRRVAADVDAGVFGDANATGGCCERRSHVSWVKLSGTVWDSMREMWRTNVPINRRPINKRAVDDSILLLPHARSRSAIQMLVLRHCTEYLQPEQKSRYVNNAYTNIHIAFNRHGNGDNRYM